MDAFAKSLFLCSAITFISGCSGSNSQEKSQINYLPVQFDTGYVYLDLETGKRAVGSEMYDFATDFYDGITLIRNDEGVRYLDEQLNLISDEQYKHGTIFNSGRAYVVRPSGHITAIDESGQSVFVLEEAEEAVAFGDGVSVFITADEQYGLVDVSGNILIQPGVYDVIRQSSDNNAGMIIVAQSHDSIYKWGVCNRDGKLVIPCMYDDIEVVCNADGNRDFIVYQNGEYGLIDENNKTLIPFDYDYLELQSNGSYLYRKDYSRYGTRYGWLSREGDEIIQPIFSDAGSFTSVGLAPVQFDFNKWGYIDYDGEVQISPIYSSAGTFDENGYAVVEDRDGYCRLINSSGKYIDSRKYGYLQYIGNSLYLTDTGLVNIETDKDIDFKGLYEYVNPEMLPVSYMKIESDFFDVHKVVEKIVGDLNKIDVEELSVESLTRRYDVDIKYDGCVELDEISNLFYTMEIESYGGWSQEYSFYDGYVDKYVVSALVVRIELNHGKVKDNQLVIRDELLKALERDGEISILSYCDAELYDMTLYISPKENNHEKNL